MKSYGSFTTNPALENRKLTELCVVCYFKRIQFADEKDTAIC